MNDDDWQTTKEGGVTKKSVLTKNHQYVMKNISELILRGHIIADTFIENCS